jgi:hypothetical protein
MSGYEQNEWITDMEDAMAPTEEPNEWKPISAAEFDSMLQKAWELELGSRGRISNAA